MSSSSRRLVGALTLSLALWCDAAWADPGPADVESAKVQFTQGLELRGKNDEAGALGHFKAAYAATMDPTAASPPERLATVLRAASKAAKVFFRYTLLSITAVGCAERKVANSACASPDLPSSARHAPL